MRRREEREDRLFRSIEATILAVAGAGAAAERHMSEGVEEDFSDFDLDPSTAVGKRLIDEQERAEAAKWLADQGMADEDDP